MKPILIVFTLLVMTVTVRGQHAVEILSQASSLSQNRDYRAAIDLLHSNENNFRAENKVSSMYGSLSWYYLFTKNFDSAEYAAHKALFINPRQTWVNVNLAHALLLQGKSTEATKIYENLVNTKSGQVNFDTYTGDLISDFKDLQKAALISLGGSQEFERIKVRIQKNHQAIQIFKEFFNFCVRDSYDTALQLLHPYLFDLPQKHAMWAAYMLTKAGEKYLAVGNKGRSKRYRLEAAYIRKQVLGKINTHSEWLTELGSIYHRQLDKPDFRMAEFYFLEAKRIQEKTKSMEGSQYGNTLSYLGNLYSDLGDYGKAEKFYLTALAAQQKALGKQDVDYAVALSNLGGFYSNHLSKDSLAEIFLLEAKNIYEKALTRECPDYTNSAYAYSLNNLGILYSGRDNYKEAEKYLLKTKEIREKIVGKLHPNYANSLYNLAALYQKMGDSDKAEKGFLEAKTLQEKVLGSKHPDYASTLCSLGAIYENKSDYKKALSCYLIAQKIFAAASGKSHPDYALILNHLGTLYLNIGNYIKAIPYYLEAKSITEKRVGKRNAYYATSLSLLGGAYIDNGDYKKAVSLLLEAKSIREEVSGRSHPDYATLLGKLGNLYQDMGEYTKAESFFSQAISIREKFPSQNHSDYAISLSDMGNLYQTMGEYKKAELFYQKAKNTLENIPGRDQSVYARTLSYLGNLYQDKGDYSTAERYLLEAKTIRENVLGIYHPAYATSLSNLGSLYQLMHDNTKAERCLLEAKTIREKSLTKNHPDYARSLVSLGRLYQTRNNYQKAASFYLEAKTVRADLLGKNHPDYANSLSALGDLYRQMGNYKAAQAYDLEAQSILVDNFGKNHPDYANSLISLGILYEDMGEYEKAEASFLEAKEIREKSLGKDSPAYATTLGNLGGLYLELNNNQKAEKYLIEAKNRTEKVRGTHHPDYALSLNNLGILYYNQGRFQKALPFYLEAKAIWETTWGNENTDFATFIDNLGLLYFQMKDFRQAEKYYLEAKSIRENLLGRSHPAYALSLGRLGDLALNSGHDKEAESYYLMAKSIAEKSFGKEHPDYIRYLNKLVLLHQNRKDYRQTTDLDIEISDLIKKLVNKNFLFLSEQQRNAYWNAEKGYLAAAWSLAQAYPDPRVNDLNYNNILFTKGLLLRTTKSMRSSIYSSGNQNIINQFEHLDSLYKVLSILQKSQPYQQDTVQALQTRVETLDKAILQSSKYYRDKNADMQLQWQDVQKQLKPAEAAIEFVNFPLYDKRWTDSTIYAALVLRPGMSSPQWISLFEQKDLLAALGDKEQLQAPQLQIDQLYADTSHILYRLIWKNLQKSLSGVKTIYYSPSGLLYKISLSALPTGIHNQRLSDIYDLKLVSSTREIAHLKTGAGSLSNKDTIALYGALTYDLDQERLATVKYNTFTGKDTSSHLQHFNINRFRRTYNKQSGPNSRSGFSNWAYLPGTATEAQQIMAALDSHQTPYKYYSKSQGDEQSFKQLSGTVTNVIHLATHGFFLPDIQSKEAEEIAYRLGGTQQALFENPLLRSGLILSGANRHWLAEQFNMEDTGEDGILTADEISRLNLTKTKLVVLSACETGLGDLKNSEGVFGLQRAFKLAGVESLIMSLWKVPDVATAELMTRFYQQWLMGHSKTEAFKMAQQMVRKKYDAPFYWAAFVMMD